MTAIDRLRVACDDAQGADYDNGWKDVEERDAEARAALAAVDALYQAAKDVNGMFPPRTRFGMTPGLIALAAAVRQVEGE